MPGLICLASLGCAARQISMDVPPLPVDLPPSEGVVAPGPTAPTNLDELLDLATRQHPELRAARARIESAQGKAFQAGLDPNPMAGPIFQEIGHKDNNWGEPGVTMAQTIVTAHKLQWDQEAAAEGAAAMQWQALTRWFVVVTRVRLAYVDLLIAQRERDTLGEMTRVSGDILQAAQTLEKAGAGNRPDVLRAKVELEQQALKKTMADTKVEAARRALAAVVGIPDLNVAELRGDLERTPPAYTWDGLVERTLSASAELWEARALVAQNEKLLARAEIEVIPNINVQLQPTYSAPDKEFRGQVMLMATVPMFNRNEGSILAARADLAKSRADEQTIALSLRERLAAAFQKFQAAKAQVDSYQKRILPDARESLRLVEVGYRGGDAKYNYTMLLQTQHTLFQAQLSLVQALGELQRAAAELAGLAQLRE